MSAIARTRESAERDAAVVTKAVVRAADRLEIKGRRLAAILGVSDATISRLRGGGASIERGTKAFELAVLFLRLFRSLDAIAGGDEAVSRAWLRNENAVLGGIPLERIQTVTGLVDVVNYLDARRAVV